MQACLADVISDDRRAAEVIRGIAEGDLGRIFEPFFTTKDEGLGMGLAISRTIVEAHGGRLLAANDPAGGATFRIHLRTDQPPTT